MCFFSPYSLQANRSGRITCGGRTAPHPHHCFNRHLSKVRLLSESVSSATAVKTSAILDLKHNDPSDRSCQKLN